MIEVFALAFEPNPVPNAIAPLVPDCLFFLSLILMMPLSD
jgi:hypothetical protein